MTEQNKQEEKNVKIFYLENMLHNKYGFNQKLSSFLSKFIVDFSENLFNDYDYEKVKHIRNAQSNIGIVAPIKNSQTKITFYIGLMDKDTFTYKFSKDEAISKIVEIIGDCTIQEAIGFYTRSDGKKIKIETLVAIVFRKEYKKNFSYSKAKILKEIFNQSSIITEESENIKIKFNDESKEFEKIIEDLMDEYDLNREEAIQAYNMGL